MALKNIKRSILAVRSRAYARNAGLQSLILENIQLLQYLQLAIIFIA
jgi:hypothetical protein